MIAAIGREVDLCGKRVVYRDSMGVWDELVLTEEGRFSSFAPIGTKDRAEAIRFASELEVA